jgi:hypothetical protein
VRFKAGPSNQQEQIKRKKVGVRKYSSRSRAAMTSNSAAAAGARRQCCSASSATAS